MNTGAFDTAAAGYDAARGFPPGVGEQVAQAAATWIGPGAQVLEVGIGTGRIAKPLLALGVKLIGLDLSRQMLERLRASPLAPALIQGDTNHLPLSGQVVDVVVSVHVFQLLADWNMALREVRRILRPGGFFLNGYEWRPPDSPGARLMERWRELLATAGQPALAAGARDFSDLKAELLQNGAACDEQIVGQWSTTRTLARQLETIEHRTWSPGPSATNAILSGCLEQLRSWAVAELGSLDQPHSVPQCFVWQGFTWR